MPSADFVFYNLRVGRSRAQIAKELNALARVNKPLTKRPALIGVCEAVGYSLPNIDGYRTKRDRSRPSRANIAAYVREDLDAGILWWIDLKFWWPRPNGPGNHAPRSWLVTRVGRIQVIVGHQPPLNARNAAQGQMEGINALARRMRPGKTPNRPRLALADWNRRKGESHGPSALAGLIGGYVVGGKIDAVVWRGGEGSKCGRGRYRRTAGLTLLKSDHKHALTVRVTAPANWWKPRTPKNT